MTKGLKPIEVVLKQEGQLIRAVPTNHATGPSHHIFIKDDDFKAKGANYGEKWLIKMVAQNGDFTYELLERAEDRFLTEIPGHWIDQDSLFDLQAWLRSGEHVCLTGSPGTGKTSLMERFAGAKNWKYIQVDCGTKQAVRDWFGADAARDSTTFHQESRLASVLRKAKTEPGKFILIGFDEINRVHPLLHNSLLALLSNQRCCEVTTVAGTHLIEAPANVFFMATKNSESNEPGAFTSGYAFRNRFQVLEVDFMPESVEADMLVQEVGIKATEAAKVVKVLNKIRSVIKNTKMSIPMPSYRDGRRAAVLVKHGKPLRYACDKTFLPGLEGNLDQAMSSRAKVAEAIKSQLPS